MLAPDGQLLCTVGRKKLAWYLDRGLAELVAEDGSALPSEQQVGSCGVPGLGAWRS